MHERGEQLLVHTAGSNPPSHQSNHIQETRWRAILAWAVATSIFPVLLTVAVFLKGVPIVETVAQGQLAQIACAVAAGALIIELKLGGNSAPKFTLQTSHLLLTVGAALLFALLQEVQGGELTTDFTKTQVAISGIMLITAAILSLITVYREFGSRD